jgi:hypothetical protein
MLQMPVAQSPDEITATLGRRRTRTPALHLSALKKGRMQNGNQKRQRIRRDRQERPALAQLAQNDNIARSAAISVGSRPGTAAPKGE